METGDNYVLSFQELIVLFIKHFKKIIITFILLCLFLGGLFFLLYKPSHYFYISVRLPVSYFNQNKLAPSENVPNYEKIRSLVLWDYKIEFLEKLQDQKSRNIIKSIDVVTANDVADNVVGSNVNKKFVILLRGTYTKQTPELKTLLTNFSNFVTEKVDDEVTLWQKNIKGNNNLAQGNYNAQLKMAKDKFDLEIIALQDAFNQSIKEKKQRLIFKKSQLEDIKSQLATTDQSNNRNANNSMLYLFLKQDVLYKEIFRLTDDIENLNIAIDSAQKTLDEKIQAKKDAYTLKVKAINISYNKILDTTKAIIDNISDGKAIYYISEERHGMGRAPSMIFIILISFMLSISIIYLSNMVCLAKKEIEKS